MANDTPETLKKRAEKSLKQQQRALEGAKGAEDYAAEGRAAQNNMERLRKERLAREAVQTPPTLEKKKGGSHKNKERKRSERTERIQSSSPQTNLGS